MVCVTEGGQLGLKENCFATRWLHCLEHSWFCICLHSIGDLKVFLL